MKTIITEPSTNTHSISGEINLMEDYGNGMLLIETNNNAKISHEEHGSDSIKTKYAFKINLKEFNPVTRELQNQFD